MDRIFASSLSGGNTGILSPDFDALKPAEALALTSHIFTHRGTLLKTCTDDQVANGLIFLGASGESD